MRRARMFVWVAAAALSLATLPAPTHAATAPTSQAGAFGPTKNACAATAYFPADSGCVTSYLSRDDDILPPPDDLHGRYRPRPPLQ